MAAVVELFDAEAVAGGEVSSGDQGLAAVAVLVGAVVHHYDQTVDDVVGGGDVYVYDDDIDRK